MKKEDIFRAISDTQIVLRQDEDNENFSEDYEFGVGDALGAVLRHLGLLDEYCVWKGDNV